MILRSAAAFIAVVLFVAFVAPVVAKLKDVALGGVILAGMAMMLVDMWQTFRDKDL